MHARLVAVLLLFSAPAVANTHPNMDRGFDPEGAFQTGQVDSVNLFNGSLSLVIPIGQSYHVNGGFSYGLTLTYNSNVWDFQQVLEQGEFKTEAIPNPFSNAGLGWTLSLGELLEDDDVPKNQTDEWMYASPDGGAHVFYPVLHQGEVETDPDNKFHYTRDGSYLRMVPEDDLSLSSWRRIEFPDGTSHTFHKVSGTWRIETMRDRFGNEVVITYEDGPGDNDEWHLTDSHGRLTKILFEDAANMPNRVAQVEVPKFGGGTAVWDFQYLDDIIARSDKDTLLANNNSAGEDRMNVSLLTKIVLPDASYFEMKTDTGAAAYNDTNCGSADCPGTIQLIRLPTGGRVAWTYQGYQYPEGPHGWLNTSTGVLERKLVDKNDADAGTWIYANERWPAGGPYDEIHTFVTAPDGESGPGTCTKHYFAAPPSLQGSGVWKGWEYGLPFTWRESQGTGTDERFLSTELFSASTPQGGKTVCDESSGPEVSTFVRFAHDKLPSGTGDSDKPDWYNSNRRVQIQTTRYDSDGLKFTKASNTDYDGIGHYRQSVITGTLQVGSDYDWSPITTVTNYNRSSGVYDIDPLSNSPSLLHTYQVLPTSANWIRGIFDYQKTTDSGVTHGQQVTRTNFSFNEATGFLECLRRLKTAETPGDNDVVELFAASNGNVSMHRIFGGDMVALDDSSTCATGGGFVSRVNHTYSYGSRATSRLWKNAPAEEFPYKSYDADIDQSTGLVARMRDPQLRWVDYTYDGLGRPLTATPSPSAATARTIYTYTNATQNELAKVAVDQRDYADTKYLTRSEIRIDDFGRPALRRQRLPGSVWSEQKTTYDMLGRVATVSVPGDVTKVTSYLDHDVLGRPTRIRPPDGSAHDVVLTYTGVRRVDTQVQVATSEAGESSAIRTELYDNVGRLREVVEAAGDGGANVTTEYAYDVGSRLSWLMQNQEGPIDQERIFIYDNRGFLTSEWHPEKGPELADGGWVNYTSYDGAGRLREMTDGPHTVSFSYDYAGRVTEVWNEAADRSVKEFVYDDDTSTYGKLFRAVRHNYHPTTGIDATATEEYTYAGLGGAVSQRTTAFGLGGYTFSQGFSWNELGQIESLTYPTCTVGTCTALPAGVGTVSSTYADGMVSGVTGWTGTISYHLNGMLDELPHSNNRIDKQTLDAGLPRPGSLKLIKHFPDTVFWDSGAFAYDGAGNIKSLGANTFVYDKVSRLVQGKVDWTSPQNPGWTQSYDYDEFGNMEARETTPPQGSPVMVTFAMNAHRNQLSMADYDEAGNMTDWGGVFTYDALNQLLQLAAPDGTWTYLYTADDERAAAVRVDGGNTGYAFYIRDLSGQLLTHFTYVGGNWTRTRDYIRAGGRLVASEGTEGERHYHTDHLGTPRVITDDAGTVVDAHDYLPFGEEVSDPAQNQLALKYTGHERDKHGSGSLDDFDYMHARYYGVYLARFTAVDPLRGDPAMPQSLNRYAYVLGNPLIYTDPSGLAALLCWFNDGQDIFRTACGDGGPGGSWEWLLDTFGDLPCFLGGGCETVPIPNEGRGPLRLPPVVPPVVPPPPAPAPTFHPHPMAAELMTGQPLDEDESRAALDAFLASLPLDLVDFGDCIETNRFDAAAALVAAGSALPKRFLPPFRVPYPHDPLTTLGSSAAHYIRDYSPGAAAGIRSAARRASTVFTPLLVFEGYYDIGTIARCGFQ